MERDFKGIWIPKEIYLNKDVCWSAKLVYLEVDSFTTNDLECFVSNAHLAEHIGISETQVSKHISLLIELGWIEQVSFNGRRRVLRSCFDSGLKADLKFTSRQSSTKLKSSLEENFKYNNTTTKTTTNSTKVKKSISLQERKKLFFKLLTEWKASHVKTNYPSEVYNQFFAHWTQTDDRKPGDDRMLFEKKETFNIGLRLATWWRNITPEDRSRMYRDDESKKSNQPQLSLDGLSEKFTAK